MSSNTLLSGEDLKFCTPFMQGHAYKYTMTFILNKNAAVAGKSRSTRMKVAKTRQPRRICKVDGCVNYIANKGRCCRHGVRWGTFWWCVTQDVALGREEMLYKRL